MISVIVPIYNLENYIETCLRSLVCQTYTDLEIILIDDGSNDRSLEICQRWGERDSRIVVMHQENQGVSVARNLGLSVAKGDYIFFVDGDDWVDAECLAQMMEKMRQEEDVSLVCCDFVTELEDGCQNSDFYHKAKTGFIPLEECIQDYYASVLYTQTIWGKLFRRELWNQVSFPKLKYSEDSFAMFRILQKVNKIYSIEQPFYHYVQRQSGASRQMGEAYYKDVLYTLYDNFVIAKERYPQYIERAGEEYVNMAYNLLKLYEREHRIQDFVVQAKKMREVVKMSSLRRPTRAQRLIFAPVRIVYVLLMLKRFLKDGKEIKNG